MRLFVRSVCNRLPFSLSRLAVTAFVCREGAASHLPASFTLEDEPRGRKGLTLDCPADDHRKAAAVP